MKLNLNSKIVGILILTLVLGTGASIFVAHEQIVNLGSSDLIDKSRVILSRLEAVREYIALQGGLDATVREIVAKNPNGNLSQDDRLTILKQVPIFAAMKVGQTEAEKDQYVFRIFSDEPRKKENMATATEMEIFKKFLGDPQLKEWVVEEKDHIAVYRPVRLSESQGCMTCHGHPSKSPWGNGTDILGYKMENWTDGKLHGVFGVISSLESAKAAGNQATYLIVMWASTLGLICLGCAFWFLRGLIRRLFVISQELKSSGEQLSMASDEISNASQSLSSSSSQAAASIEETTASTEEMSSMIKLNADSATEAQRFSTTCLQNAQNGRQEMERLLEAMTEISKSSKQIEDIVSVIDDIAFQTNLLALNAAVEAARAGDQGKGFAVVADAVRTLAQRSASSAKEISQLIQASVEKIHQGSAVAEKSGKSLNEIVTSIERVVHLNTEIANASQEQSQGVQGINQAINELDKVTQQNAAGSEETAASSVELKAQSKKVYELVAQLSSIIDGGAGQDKKAA